MCFDEDFVFAISQGNIATLDSFELDEDVINQRFSYNPAIRCPTGSFTLPKIPHPTPLTYAIACKQIEVTKYLIQKGASLAIDIDNWYPIHYAVASHDVELAEAILACSPTPEIELERKTINDKASPLHVAVSSGEIEMVLCLLQNGADVNSTNIFGDTPLHLSMVFPSDLIARALIAYRANIHIKNLEGQKASAVARDRFNQELADLMTAYENQAEPLPEINEIELEMAQNDITKLRKRILRTARAGGSVSSTKVEEMDGRLHTVEANIEKIFDTLSKIRVGGVQSQPTKCASCFAPVATECPLCHIFYCETCMRKGNRHSCAAKK